MSKLSLGFGLAFADLYARDGLVKLDAAFLDHLDQSDTDLARRLAAARAAPDALDDPDGQGYAQLMVEVAPHVDDFVAALFAI